MQEEQVVAEEQKNNSHLDCTVYKENTGESRAFNKKRKVIFVPRKGRSYYAAFFASNPRRMGLLTRYLR